MITTLEPTTSLRVARLIKAPRERVFEAWTTPADIMSWFGPEGCQVHSAKLNLRQGGEYHLRLKTETFGEILLHVLFMEVKHPSKLIYTWNFSGHPKLEFGESLVAVEFVDRKDWTEIQINHDGLPSEEVREDHNQGWKGCLDKLERHLPSSAEGAPQTMPIGQFSWNELLTSDEPAAIKFYSQVFGWQATDFPATDTRYMLWKQNGKEIGGLMQRPSEEIPPHWLGYVTVADVDKTTKTAAEAGGKICLAPLDVPTVGRIAVIQDPQGAALGIFQPLNKPTICRANQLVWCDIPVNDLDRAIQFYSAVLDAPITKEQCEGMSFARLPHAGGGVGGCLSPSFEGNEPSQRGPLLYLNCQGRLDQALAAVGPNGGKVLQPKQQISPYGFRAIVIDSEGNRIALHSM